MKIQHLNNLNVCILGFGREGQATLRNIKRYAPNAKITIADENDQITVEPDCAFITGHDYLSKLDDFDVIVKSPGINWRPSGELAQKLTSATEIFLDSLPEGVRTIGVTGTKGKSSTSNLIYQVLNAAGISVYLAGNIGEPMLDHLSDATPDTTFVLELSSYQLENLRVSPQIAVITSFFPDHVDYHGSLKNYFDAKTNITKHQNKSDVVFYNSDFAECHEIARHSVGQKVPFSGTEATSLNKGTSNFSNNAAAYKVALYCGVPSDVAKSALESAKGLPHRQQSLGIFGGIEWIDDSAATTPQSTETALDALADRVDTLIVGGLNRSYNFERLGQHVAKSSIVNIILFPDTGALIKSAIESAEPTSPKKYLETSDMNEAVQFARLYTRPGKVCLLSSGSPSYNLFKNYPERGGAFAASIHRSEPAST